MYLISVRFSFIFSSSIFTPFSQIRSISSYSFLSWSTRASVSDSPTPYTRISSALTSTPSKPSKTICSLLWYSSPLDDNPKGRGFQQYLPSGVQNVVRFLDPSASFTWKNPSLASNSEKQLALLNFGNTYSIVGIGKWFLLIALFKSLGAMHILQASIQVLWEYHHSPGLAILWLPSPLFAVMDCFTYFYHLGLTACIHTYQWIRAIVCLYYLKLNRVLHLLKFDECFSTARHLPSIICGQHHMAWLQFCLS